MQTIQHITILGGGPAGCSAALLLKQNGFSVTLIDRKALLKAAYQATPKPGESLPPEIQTLLQELGLWERFLQSNALPAYCNISYWGTTKAQYHDFMNHPLGHAWHIDRTVFEQMLINACAEKAIEILDQHKLVNWVYQQQKWQLQFANGKQLTSDFLIDASGRSSWFARQQSRKRLYEHRQLALLSFLQAQEHMENTNSLIETTANGWWYSAGIPGHRLVTCFFCKPTNKERKNWLHPQVWKQLLEQAPQTNARLKQTGYQIIAPPQFVAADSSILDQTYGDAWAAIGDAALTYDPISAHGITMAMLTAKDICHAIQLLNQGQMDSLKHYNNKLWIAFDAYARARKQYYKQMTTLSKDPFWRSPASILQAKAQDLS